jgi:hypothetical protein
MTNPAQYRSDASRSAQRHGAQVISWHRSALALLVGTIVLLVSAMYAVAPAQSSSALKRCGAIAQYGKFRGTVNYNIFVNVRARGASCETARGIAKQWQSNHLMGAGCVSRTCRVRSFKCTPSTTKIGDVLLDCRRSGARVLFTYRLSFKG